MTVICVVCIISAAVADVCCVLCVSSALLQLMAAAEARRDVCYFTFGDTNLCEELIGVHSVIVDKQLSVGERRV